MAGTAFNTANWSGYDEATATNPSASLTGFTLLIDVSTLSADWKAAVQSEGADIRVAKGDDTELAYDLIEWAYNAGSPTGWIRALWSGTLANSGTQNVRVYAGYTGGTATAYDSDETYGSDNAYDANWLGYWPAGGGSDRTANGYTLSPGSAGNPTAGGVVGLVGTATRYDGSNDYCTGTPTLPTQWTTMCWFYNAVDASGSFAEFAESPGHATRDRTTGFNASSNAVWVYQYSGSDKNAYSGAVSPVTGTWHHAAGVYDGTNLSAYANSSPGTPVSSGNPYTGYTTPEYVSGRYQSNYFAGLLDDLQLHNTGRSAAWISEEYAQSNSQATFWGTWEWTAGGAPASILPLIHYYRTCMAG
jgi:hypothetical protein